MRRSCKQIKLPETNKVVWVYSIRWMSHFLGCNTHYLRRLQWNKFFPKPVLHFKGWDRWYLAEEIVGYCQLSKKYPWYHMKKKGVHTTREQFKIAAHTFRETLAGKVKRGEPLHILTINLPPETEVRESDLDTHVAGGMRQLERVKSRLVLKISKTKGKE